MAQVSNAIVLDIVTRKIGVTDIDEFVIVSGETVLNRTARLSDAIGIRERYVVDHNLTDSPRTAFIGETPTTG